MARIVHAAGFVQPLDPALPQVRPFAGIAEKIHGEGTAMATIARRRRYGGASMG
jgi:hypothetical protein